MDEPLADLKALIMAFEKFMDNHPELEGEMQNFFQEELRSVRVQSLERAFFD
jgi:hypothetical protein